jgi:hypothetical protein
MANAGASAYLRGITTHWPLAVTDAFGVSVLCAKIGLSAKKAAKIHVAIFFIIFFSF